jgi:pyruvate,water dikinase
MGGDGALLDLADAGLADRARVGGKAKVLGELATTGLPVPPGVVVPAAALNTDGWEAALAAAAGRLGARSFAVRSSSAAEDLPDASYAGLYETYLNVPRITTAAAAARPRWRCWCRRWSTRSRPGWRSPPIR